MFLSNSAVIAFLLAKPLPEGQPTSLLLAAIRKNALQRCGWHEPSFPVVPNTELKSKMAPVSGNGRSGETIIL